MHYANFSHRLKFSLAKIIISVPIFLLISKVCFNNSCGIFNLAGIDAASTTNEIPQPAVSSSAQDGVITLTSKNFDSSLRDGKIWLIEFYAPWCSHCVRFAPTYEQVAKQLHSQQKSHSKSRQVNVAKVDGAAERALSSRFSVRGFPTFFLIDGWTVREYEGNRSQENLIKFALEDYRKVEPMPFLFGPFGPMGQARALLMWIGTVAIGVYENLTVDRGIKPLVAMSILCASITMVGLILISVIGILCMSKLKHD